MGLCVFLLISFPAVALLFVPLTGRRQHFHLTPAPARSPHRTRTAAAKGLNAMQWAREAEEHFRPSRKAA